MYFYPPFIRISYDWGIARKVIFQLFFYLFNKLDEINYEGHSMISPFYQKSVEITHKINNKIAFFFYTNY